MKKIVNRKKWLNRPARLTKNSLSIDRFQVMQRWEEPYMAKLASIVTKNGGRILEVGFGMGISAKYIQKSNKIQSHIIIECHPDIIKFACKKFKKQIIVGRLTIINGFWEDILPFFKNNSFDGILFDSFEPYDEHQFFPFSKEAHRLLKKGGVFTYFASYTKKFSKKHLEDLNKARFSKIDYEICKVNPSRYCQYWEKNTIVAPILIK